MNPRYILYTNLVINDIILLTMFTLIQLLSYIVFTLNVSLCIALILVAVASSINSPLTLALMAIECYIAVCFPLRHTQVCTVRKTYAAIGTIWLLSALYILSDLFAALASESPEFFQSNLFCFADAVFRQPYRKKKIEISNIVLMVLVWLILFYTYFKILSAARAAAHDAKKARNTVLLHGFQLLLCMLTYVYYVIVKGLLMLFPRGIRDIRFSVTILVHVLPRLISPVIYGLRDKTFRKYLKTHLFCTTNTETRPQKTT
ncbi:olfactory receptor 1493-like [Cynoglossus semilaevis]|nr:olfactory receptor 1493-like [Cynoglossus semilaevis]